MMTIAPSRSPFAMNRLSLENTLIDDRFAVLRCIAQGSYAEIFIANDHLNGATVIIKALNTSLQGSLEPELDRVLVENFETEAQVLDTIRHPNIVRRLGHGMATDLQGKPFYFLVLEYMAGGNLLDFCRSHGPLSLEETLFYFQQVAEGLEHAHESQIIHRDMKPSNLLLSADLKVIKIADFGVAKIAHREDEEITRVGTNVYAPPEHHPNFDGQITWGRRLTPAADIYALAKTIYTVLSGKAPQMFNGRPITALPHPLITLPYSQELLRILQKATAADSRERYPDVESFWTDFSRLGEWQEDEVTRVQPRSARSAPLEIPEAPPAAHFIPATQIAPAATEHGETRLLGSVSASESRGPIPKPVSRIVIPIDSAHSTQPVSLRKGNAPSEQARGGKSFIPLSIPEGTVPQTIAANQPATTPEIPVQPRPSRWWAIFTPGVIHWLTTLTIAILFVTSLVVIYRTTKQYVADFQFFKTRGIWTRSTRYAVTTTGVNVRSAPRVENNVVGELARGVRVEILEEQGRWYRVRPVEWVRRSDTSVEDGWVSSQFFGPTSSE
ncbi:MAG: protein kinase [Acidobacteria bacterium]|nr:protein kinase [Acidobacteriota bacterium]